VERIDDSPNRQKGTARNRVLDAARTLFSKYSVSGTSLQMIADHLGVTKAAVYHQFRTKEEIVVTLLEKPLAELEVVVTEAEANDTREDQLDVLLKGLVDIVLENPEIVSMIQGDPAAARILQARHLHSDVERRLSDLFSGPNPDPGARVASVLFGAGLMLIGHHSLISDIDPDTMRRELPRIGKRMLR
jgi:AcrR family transcriptional regulator